MLLTDFDASRQAVINPDMLFSPVPDLPETVVSCFSHVTFERMLNMAADVRVLAELGDANAKYPVYRGLWQGTPLTFALAMVGAPSCVAMLEELHALGAKRFVVFGNCGVLNQQIRDCGIIIPTAAVRDEGTSFHYAPPSDEIPANPKYRRAFEAILRETGVDFTEGKVWTTDAFYRETRAKFEAILRETGVDFTEGKVWTTDAFYRETRAKFEKRKAQGCVCVDMECSALMALAQFRGIDVFEFFYAGDNLDREQWDPRSLSTHAKLDEKDRAAYLALELARKIS